MLKWIEEELAALQGVTPGPWDEKYVYEAVRHIARNCDFIGGDDPEFGWDRYGDHAHIARWSPDRVEKLLRLLDEAHTTLQAVVEMGVQDLPAVWGRVDDALESIEAGLDEPRFDGGAR